jgi:hypothetical protein
MEDVTLAQRPATTPTTDDAVVFSQRNQYIAAGLLLLGIVCVVALTGIEDAISTARLNATFGEATLAYKVRVSGASAAEFLLLAVPGLLLAIRGHRLIALVPLAIMTLDRATVPVDPGFEATIGMLWLVLAAAPTVWLVRTAPAHLHPRLPAELWVLVAVAVTGLLVWYVEVIFSPVGYLVGAPAGYAAFLAFGLLLGTPRGWWLMAHGLLLGLALTAHGIAHGWMAPSLPIGTDAWSLASLVGPVAAGILGSAVHRISLTDSSTPLHRPAT